MKQNKKLIILKNIISKVSKTTFSENYVWKFSDWKYWNLEKQISVYFLAETSLDFFQSFSIQSNFLWKFSLVIF